MYRRTALALVVAAGGGPRVIVDDGAAMEDTTSDSVDAGEGEAPRPEEGPAPDPTTPDPTTFDPTRADDTTSSADGPSDTTTGPTTAADDGGTPGGVGDGATPDNPGDVDLPSADIVAAAVYTDGVLADFRVQLVEPPFDGSATHSIDWCIDGSAGGGTYSCGTHGDGIESFLSLSVVLDGEPGQFQSSTPGVDVCLHGAFEAETNTLRMLIPLVLVDDDGEFDWIVTSYFGGSGGANEWTPDFGQESAIAVAVLPPFDGTPTCF